MLLGEPDKVLPEFVKSHNLGGLITDFTPLRKPLKWLKDVTAKLPKNFPVCQVSNLISFFAILFSLISSIHFLAIYM